MSVMFYNKFDGAAVSTVRNSNSLVPTIAARAAVTPKKTVSNSSSCRRLETMKQVCLNCKV